MRSPFRLSVAAAAMGIIVLSGCSMGGGDNPPSETKASKEDNVITEKAKDLLPDSSKKTASPTSTKPFVLPKCSFSLDKLDVNTARVLSTVTAIDDSYEPVNYIALATPALNPDGKKDDAAKEALDELDEVKDTKRFPQNDLDLLPGYYEVSVEVEVKPVGENSQSNVENVTCTTTNDDTILVK